MEPAYFEILHSDSHGSTANQILALISGDSMLKTHLTAWPDRSTPTARELYVLIVIVGENWQSQQVDERLAQIGGRSLPIIPVVACGQRFDFAAAPPAIASRNAIRMDCETDVVDALLHHAGLLHSGKQGQAMISYCRRDGDEIMQTLEAQLESIGFQVFVDLREPGGVSIQTNIEAAIRRSDIVFVIDTLGAARSKWVGIELDMARAAHVPVIAITPSAGADECALYFPHVAWEAGDSTDVVGTRATTRARRLLARKAVFRSRVGRVLEQLSRFRGWPTLEDGKHWLVDNSGVHVRVESTEQRADAEAVVGFSARVGAGQGVFVGGTRPYSRNATFGLEAAGQQRVRVAALSQVAVKVSDRATPSALAGRRIFLSAAMPDDPEQRSSVVEVFPEFLLVFAQAMFGLGATVVYGGHPSVTPSIHRAVKDLVASDAGSVELHQAKYWLTRGTLPQEVGDRTVFSDVQWHGAGHDAVEDLTTLRAEMITDNLDAAVFVGGATTTSIGGSPGILDEFERFRAACPTKPAFVLGLGKGAACELLATRPRDTHVDPLIAQELAETTDPDLATALIVAQLIRP